MTDRTATPNFREPDEADISRFCVAVCAAHEDSALVLKTIKDELADWPEPLHAAILTATLRTVVARYYGTLARRIEREDPGCISAALQAQGAANAGLPVPDAIEWARRAPALDDDR